MTDKPAHIHVNDLAFLFAHRSRNQEQDRNELQELELFLYQETDKAILVSEFPMSRLRVWLPKSQVEWTLDHVIYGELGRMEIIKVYAPYWLAEEKDLI